MMVQPNGCGGLQPGPNPPCNRQVPLRSRPVVGQHRVHQAEQLHHTLVLAQVLVALRAYLQASVLYLLSLSLHVHMTGPLGPVRMDVCTHLHVDVCASMHLHGVHHKCVTKRASPCVCVCVSVGVWVVHMGGYATPYS